MQFPNIVAHCGKQNLRPDIPPAPGQKAAEVVIFLHHTKCPFRLNRTIHPQQDTCFTGNAFQGFCPLFNESLGYRYFPVTFRFGAFRFVWTSFTAFALVMSNLTDITGLALSFTDILCLQLHAVLAGIFICAGIIEHVFPKCHIAFELFCFGPFVVGWFNVTSNFMSP